LTNGGELSPPSNIAFIFHWKKICAIFLRKRERMLRLHWFGNEPWSLFCEGVPRTHAPYGTKCLECGEQIKGADRGVVAPCSPRTWGHWWLQEDDREYSVCSYHLVCWLEQVSNGVTDGTTIQLRAEGAETRTPPGGLLLLSDSEMDSLVSDLAALDVDEIKGRGWRGRMG
jgi:hypothetical protein